MSREAVVRWAASSSAASAALEGRVVPPGFVRSTAAQAYLDTLRLAAMSDRKAPPLPMPPTFFNDQRNYQVEVDADGPVVYSECCADRMDRKTALRLYRALGAWLGKAPRDVA